MIIGRKLSSASKLMKAYLSYGTDINCQTFNHRLWINREPEGDNWCGYISDLSQAGIKMAIAENCEIVTGIEITGVEFDCDGYADVAQELERRAIGKRYVNICPDDIADMLSNDFGYCIIGCSWDFA